MRLVIAAFMLTVAMAAPAAACDQAAIGQRLQATWEPRMRAASGSVCETAAVLINMLNDTRRSIRSCFPQGSQMAIDADAELVGRIRQAQRTQSDAGCR